MRLIEDFFRGQRVLKGSGGVFYGPDSSIWPARWFDAVEIIQGEIQREDAAFQKALRAKQK